MFSFLPPSSLHIKPQTIKMAELATTESVHGSVSHINQSLLELLSQQWPGGWRLHPKLIYFNNAQDKARKQLLLYNKLINNGNPEEFAQAEVNDLKLGDTVSDGVRSLKQSGSILLLSGLAEKDLEHKRDGQDHVILLFLKNRTVSLYSIYLLIYICC